MRIVRVALLMSLMTAVPGIAHASLWDWIQEMSGPGPFKGYNKTLLNVIYTACPGQAAAPAGLKPFDNSRDKVPDPGIKKTPCWFFDSRLLRYDGSGSFPAAVDVHAIDGGIAWQFASYQRFSVGVGMGVMRFTGRNDATTNAFALTLPRVDMMPLAIIVPLFVKPSAVTRMATHPALRILKFHLGGLYLPRDFDATNFGVEKGSGPQQSTFSTSHEYLLSRGFFVDLGELIPWLSHMQR